MLSRELGRVESAWLGLRWDDARWFESAPVSGLWDDCLLTRKDPGLRNWGALGSDDVLARIREEAVAAVAWRLEGRSRDWGVVRLIVRMMRPCESQEAEALHDLRWCDGQVPYIGIQVSTIKTWRRVACKQKLALIKRAAVGQPFMPSAWDRGLADSWQRVCTGVRSWQRLYNCVCANTHNHVK